MFSSDPWKNLPQSLRNSEAGGYIEKVSRCHLSVTRELFSRRRGCHRRDRSRAGGREFLVVAGLGGGDRGQAPHEEKAPQMLVSGGVVRSIHRSVVLPEEFLMLSFGESSQDHQRIGGVFRRLCGHMTEPTPGWRARLARRTG
jgi:hypothetical protein